VRWWLLRFARRGPARYLSHLDTARALQRTLARAGVRLALSEGMRPKPRLSLPLPLPVGAAAADELAVVGVEGGTEAGPAALRALRAAAPPGLEILAIVDAGGQHPRPQARAATYACRLEGDSGALLAAVARLRESASLPYERRSPKGLRRLDLKEYVEDLRAEPLTGGVRLAFRLPLRADGAARPQEVVDAVAAAAGVEPVAYDLERTGVTWSSVPPATVAGGGRS